MNKSRWKRIVKMTGGVVITMFLAVFIWANWNERSPAERLKPKIFALYDLSGIKDNNVFSILNTQLKKTRGVLATCVKPTDKIVSVVFYPDILSRTDIQNKLSEWSNVQVNIKQIVASGPTCPVAGMMGTLSRIKRFLCIRN